MFGDLFGNLQKQQEELQQKLAGMSVEAESGDGAIVVQASADLQVHNIRLDPTKIDLSDREQLEDLLVIAVNRALDAARAMAAAETNNLLQGMMPGGLDAFMKP
jgi:DNA-binding protein YbaB